METAQDASCHGCRTPIRPDAEWCPLCYAPVDRDESVRSFAHPDAFIGPPQAVRYSRWVKSDVSYGPSGRIIATLLLWLVPLWWGLMYSPILAIFWLCPVGPLLLRDIWKRTRIRS